MALHTKDLGVIPAMTIMVQEVGLTLVLGGHAGAHDEVQDRGNQL